MPVLKIVASCGIAWLLFEVWASTLRRHPRDLAFGVMVIAAVFTLVVLEAIWT